MNKNFNYEQNLALENPINIDLQVSAGAGSGKTKTLSEKVMLLIEQGLKPSELLVLTFTNNAAHEMKERIIQKFSDRKEIAYQLASAHIQTFDSFSQYLVSSYLALHTSLPVLLSWLPILWIQPYILSSYSPKVLIQHPTY